MFRRAVPFVAQIQRNDCGLACVAMVLRFYRSFFTLRKLSKFLESGRDGIGLKEINHLLNQLNFNTKIYKITTDKISTIPTPAILYWSNSHFVVLDKVYKNSILIVDPGQGKRKLSYTEFAKDFSNFAIYAYPNAHFKKEPKDKCLSKMFFILLSSSKRFYMKITCYAILSYFLTIGIPIIIQAIVDLIYIRRNTNYQIDELFTSLGLVFFILSATNYFKDKNLSILKTNLNKTISENVFLKLLNLPYKFFDNRSNSSILYTLNSIHWVKDIFADTIVQGVIDIGSLIFILVYIGRSPILILISLVLIFLNMIIVFAFSKFTLEKNSEILIEENKIQNVQNECINSMFEIKMSALEDDFKKDWLTKFDTYIKKNLLLENTLNKIKFLFSFLQYISPGILFYAGVQLMNNGAISLGVVIAIYSMASSLFATVNSLMNSFFKCQGLKPILERLIDIVDQPLDNNDKLLKVDISGMIELKNVYFSYTKNSKLILKNINLKIKPGQKIGIVGKSGAGKSTLAKVIAGIYEPSSGEILFDGIDFETTNKSYIRKQLGIVSQGSRLFNKTIYDNIVMEKKDIRIDTVKEVCKLVQIDKEIEKSPMGYYTMISEYGQNLSGGQCQRIVLARSIINKPKILILDEATSSLDNLNEERISNLISETGCTRVVITHRLSTVSDSDVIIVIDNGEIIAQGNHKILMQRCDLYRNMYNQSETYQNNSTNIV